MNDAGDELARSRVVVTALGERLADALREPAVHLAFDDHRVDDLAEVVDRGEVHDSRRARYRGSISTSQT